MPSKYEIVKAMAADETLQITSNTEKFMAFLRTAANNYKYTFHEQVLIHAQKPSATACAEIDTWNKLNRWVNRGTRGIALLVENDVRYKLRYVFDLSDTNSRAGREIRLWQLEDRYLADVKEALSNSFGEANDAGDFRNFLMEIAENVVDDNLPDYLSALEDVKYGSLLEELDELNTKQWLRDTLVSSVGYMLLTRCGYDPDELYTFEDFSHVLDFNTGQTIAALGVASSDISEMVLREIETTVRAIQRQERVNARTFAEKTDTRYDKGKEKHSERSNIYGTDLYNAGRLSDPEPESPGPPEGGQVWNAAAQLPAQAQESALPGHAADQHPEQPSGAGGQGSQRDDGDLGRHDGQGAGRDGEDESREPDAVGGPDEQHPGSSRGSGSEGTHLQLSDLSPELPPLLDEKLITAVFENRNDDLDVKKDHIQLFFLDNPDRQRRADYLRSVYQDRFTELIVDGQRVGYYPQENGLLIWEGAFLSRTKESVFDWLDVADRTGKLIDQGLYYANDKVKKPKQIDDGQISFMTPGYIAPSGDPDSQMTFFSQPQVSQQVIDEALCVGFNDKHTRQIICAYFMKDKSLADNADFLKRKYGTNGAGFYVDDQQYALWYDPDGIRIATGNTVRKRFVTEVSWEQAAKRIRELLDLGRYMPQYEIDEALDYELEQLANQMLHTAGDFTQEAKDAGYLPLTREVWNMPGGFPEMTKQLKILLRDPEKLQSLVDEWGSLVNAYNDNRHLLRFRFYRVQETLTQLQDLQREPVVFKAQETYYPHRKYFISEDELANVLRQGRGNTDYRLQVYSFFCRNKDMKSREKYLRDYHGTSGSFTGNDNRGYSSKGLLFSHGSLSMPYAKVELNWAQVTKRITKLIEENNFLYDEDRAAMGEYERKQLARSIHSFFFDTPDGYARPYSENSIGEYWEGVDTVFKQLSDPDRVKDIYQNMMIPLWARAKPEDRHYNSQKTAMDNMQAYLNGTYSVFNLPYTLEPLPVSSVVEVGDVTVDTASIRRKLADAGVVDGEVVDEERLSSDPFIQQVEVNAEALVEPQYEVGDHFTLHEGDTTSDLVISSMDNRTVFYRIPAEHSNQIYDMERVRFDTAIREGKLSDQRQETTMEKAQRIIDAFCIQEYDEPADYDDMRNVGVCYTTITDDEIPIQNNINLVEFSLDRYIEGVIVERRQYDTLEELIDKELEELSFEDLISFTEEQLSKVVIKPQDIRYLYEVGDTVYLDNTAFRITKVRDHEVQLLDPTQAYPIYRVENRNRFPQLLAQDERNRDLREIPITSPPMAPPAAPLPKAKAVLGVLHPEIPADQRHNYRITDDDLGVGTPGKRYANNVAAIRLLKRLEREDRLATPEEQEVLSKYVGWGGLAVCFEENHSRYQELKSLLTEEEYEAARESSLTAFYTPPVVIRAMYQALEKMNFQRGNILEPSCGVGNFLGMLPDSMGDSQLYGVELDSISGRIAQQLYQKSSIAVQGFEKTDLPDSFFDVAVGNVPFGQFKVPDKQYDKHNFLIHDYFFARTLDKVRPGGIVAFITSKGTMDKENPAVRKYIAQRADLLGAIRLPNDTFKGAAGTEVTSDIIFLQKRDRMVDIEPDWVHLNTDENGHKMNQYFIDNPDMILGQMQEVSGPFGPELACVPFENLSLEELLSDAIQNIHAEITEYDLEEALDGEEDKSIPAIPEVRNFSFAVVEGQLYYRENSRMNPVDVSATAENRIKGMIAIRDSVRQLIEYQTEDFPEHFIQSEQAKLNKLYDEFSKKYGLINSRANNSAFSSDSSYCLLASLEVLDDEGNFIRKADMFSKRTIRQKVVVTSVDTASEALALSLAEKARIDMSYMQELTGKTEDQLYNDLQGVIFLNPEFTGDGDTRPKYLPADEYLSGNVRKKLTQAKLTAELHPEFQINVQALEKVQPQDLSASEISVRLGATWLPADVVEQFMYELFSTPRFAQWKVKVHYTPVTGEWYVSEKNYDRSNVKAANTYGTSRINGYKIIEETLNLKDVRIFDYQTDSSGKRIPVLNKRETAIAQGKQEMIKQAFQDWIWKDPRRRERLCKRYNVRFNSTRPREYDGSHLNFVGMNPEIHLRPHQVNAIARILYNGNTLLAHEVGAGKTYEMVAAAMESKRLGLCQKSLFVVPNHLTEQLASEFLQLYPSANILVATKKDFEAKNRKKFCGRIATGDYDAIIIGHSQFEKIPMSVERQKAILQQQINEIMTGIAQAKRDRAENFTVKQMERTRKHLKAKLEKLNDQTRKDDLVTFEELGVDRIFVDEAHYYKNLAAYTKMRNVGGISQTEAQKSSDLYMKCRYLDELTGGRGVIFATGTPISNSMVEMYTMQKYLQYSTLDQEELLHFDAWASNFGETVTAIELAPEGSGYRAKTRFSRFYNLPELMSMFKEVADIQTADMLKLPVPKANYHNVVLKPSEQQKQMVAALSERAEKVRNKMVDSSVDNMLLITNDGRKLALDQRLMNHMLGNSETGKTTACADNVFRIWEEHKEDLATQMVFCDLSTPHNDGNFNVYDDLRTKLIAKGIPEEQIAYIHSANTEAQKKELFGKVRSGQIRVLIGSTQKMGAGTNVQKRLIALHHLDCPWRPSDLQQREGRIVRQGNMHKEVDIFTYVTENTFDSYLYQLVESKQKFIGQIMTSKSPVRSAEDIDETALSYAEIKALCTGNPHIKEKMDLDIEVQKLRLMKANHLSQRYSLEDQIIKEFPQQIKTYEQMISGLEADITHVKEHTHPNDDGFSPMVIEGIIHTTKKAAGSAILEVCSNMTSPDPIPLGTYRGFSMRVHFDSLKREFMITLQGQLSYPVSLGTDIFGNIQRLDNTIDSFTDRLTACRAQLDNVHAQLEAAKLEVEKPFPKEDELKQKTARLDELNILLNLDKKENEIVDGERDDDDPPSHKPLGRDR